MRTTVTEVDPNLERRLQKILKIYCKTWLEMNDCGQMLRTERGGAGGWLMRVWLFTQAKVLLKRSHQGW